MRRTILLLAVFALALAIVVTPAAAVASRDGRWVGSNSQDEPFKLTVRHEEIVEFLTHLNFSRCDMQESEQGKGLSIPIRADGTFRAKLVGTKDPKDTLTIAGEFTAPRRASGTVRVALRGGDCNDTVKATWKVTKQ